MSEQGRRILRDSIPAIVAAVLSSMIGGGLSTYVAYNVLAHRVSTIEKRLDDQEQTNRIVSDQLGKVAQDVQYIRGLLEGRSITGVR